MAPRASRRWLDLDRVGSREADDLLAASGRPAGPARGMLALRGGPVLPLPPHMREAATAALDEPDRRTTRGLLELREAIAADLGTQAGRSVDPARELIVTNGAMQGLATVFRALLDPGDEVVIPVPNFFFDGSVVLAGGVPVHVPCDEATGWAWDLDRIRAAVSERTRAVIVCNPTNPTGMLPSREELTAIVALAQERDLVVVSDESYHHSAYAGRPFTPMASFADAADRVVVVRSLSKSHALAGWRMGYVHGPAALVEAFSKVFEWECLHCAYAPQRVATAALTGPQDWLAGVNDEYEAIRDTVAAALERSAWLSAVTPAAAPFFFLDLSRAEAETGVPGDEQLRAHGVHTVPGRFFHGPGHVRLPFGADPHTVTRLTGILESFEPVERATGG